MSDSGVDDNQMLRDVVIPGIFLLVMFVANAILFAFIMHKRKKVVWEDPSIYQACLDADTAAEATATATTPQGFVTLEMEQLKQ